MQLNIKEFDDNEYHLDNYDDNLYDDNLYDDNLYDDNVYDDNLYDDNIKNNTILDYTNQQSNLTLDYNKIPENNAPIKVIKKNVRFDDSTFIKQTPIHQSIPKVNTKVVRPQTPHQKPRISYEEILSKMGMFVSDGKLHLVDRNTLTPQQQQKLPQQQEYKQPIQSKQQVQNERQQVDVSNIPKNSYIYNKYFKDQIQPENNIRKPKTLHEYKMMLIDDYIQKKRIKNMKSTKLMMPTSNINFSEGGNPQNFTNLQNKLFSFSKR